MPSKTHSSTLAGMAKAVAAIKKSPRPLVLYWRHTLHTRGVNVVLALPRHHRKPAGGIVVGHYSAELFGTDRATYLLGLRRLRSDIMAVRRWYLCNIATPN